MNTARHNPIPASRHSLGLPAHGVTGIAQLLHQVMQYVAAALDTAMTDALPLTVPGHGFRPETDTLCSAHWNRAYLIRGAKF